MFIYYIYFAEQTTVLFRCSNQNNAIRRQSLNNKRNKQKFDGCWTKTRNSLFPFKKKKTLSQDHKQKALWNFWCPHLMENTSHQLLHSSNCGPRLTSRVCSLVLRSRFQGNEHWLILHHLFLLQTVHGRWVAQLHDTPVDDKLHWLPENPNCNYDIFLPRRH